MTETNNLYLSLKCVNLTVLPPFQPAFFQVWLYSFWHILLCGVFYIFVQYILHMAHSIISTTSSTVSKLVQWPTNKLRHSPSSNLLRCVFKEY